MNKSEFQSLIDLQVAIYKEKTYRLNLDGKVKELELNEEFLKSLIRLKEDSNFINSLD